MGAADFNTSVKLHGTRDEVLAMLKVLKSYATEKHEQYKQKRNCPYLMSVFLGRFQVEGLAPRINCMTDEEMLELIDKLRNTVLVDASGPYGVFGMLEDLTIFQEMAEVAPNASFTGGIGGFDPGGDHAASYELKDGLLYCKFAEGEEWCEDDDEDWDEDEDDDCDEDWGEEPDWTVELVYDPIKKKYVK